MGMSIFVGAILTGTARRAAAATVTVTNANDTGAGSLRDAIATANAGDTVAFNVPNGSVVNIYNPILIDKSLTISGPGAANLTVQRSTNAENIRVFEVDDGTPAQSNVTIAGLTIANGYYSHGAGIGNYENLTISGCVITNNDTGLNSGQGGAIRSDGNLTVKDSTISGNAAWASGAAIASSNGNVTIQNSTISDNHVRGYYIFNGPKGYPGGAVFKTGLGELKVTGSTLAGNTATGSGGAVYLRSNNGIQHDITACTLSGNTSDTNGGAIALNGDTHLELKNSTVSDNSASGAGGGMFIRYGYYASIANSTIAYNYSTGSGGGIYCESQTVDMVSTIVSGNRTDSSGRDLSGRFSGYHSLVSDTSGATTFGFQYTNQIAYLGLLQNNGGPTLTRALLAGSPCFEHGIANGLATDQRGLPRVSGVAADIGAFEAQAASFVVKNLNDSGADSLRQCVLDANASAGPDIITFQSGLTGTIGLTSGQIKIQDHTTIQGPGSAVITVSGNNNSRVFYASDDDSNTNFAISISGLTIANGAASNGAGIFSSEILSLTDTVLTGNVSTSNGGGLCQNYGKLTIKDCAFNANSASNGGGIYVVRAYTTITNSTIKSNTTTGNGAGIYLYNTGASITNATISGNSAASRGGGMYLYGSFANVNDSTLSGNSAVNGGGTFIFESSNLSLDNSTVSGNSATKNGGGIYLHDGTLRVSSSTIAFNKADSDANGSGKGGGVYLDGEQSPSAYLNNTIVAMNTDYAGKSDFYGNVQSSSTFNILGVDTGSTNFLTDGLHNNQVGSAAVPIDPQLGPLQDNGGPTFTHAIAVSSVAHDRGDFSGSFPPFDQRGKGFRRVSDRNVDIGAFEFQDPPLTFVVKNLNDSGPDSLRDCISAANSAPSADIVTFEPGLTGTIALLEGQLFISDNVSITGPGANVITVTAPRNNRIFLVNDNTSKNVDVSISGLTLSGGYAESGGAIYNEENLTISDCILTGNSAGVGGAVGIDYGASLTIRNTTINGNSAYYGGGAIAVPIYSNVLIENCTITGNAAVGDGGSGGGIYVSYRLNRKRRGYSSITLRNNTITENSASYGYGGGIFAGSVPRGQPDNSPRDKGPVSTGIILTSNIIAKNTSYNGSAPDISALLNPVGANNLIGVDSALSGLANGINANQIGTGAAPLDPLVGPLQLNGGVIPTQALLVGSPALDTGSNVDVLASDERDGLFARDAGSATDIGAFENQLPVLGIGGPYTVAFGSGLSLSAAATDLDGDTITYTWDINGDGTFGDATESNPTLTSAQLVALGIGNSGTFTVTVQATDGFHTVSASTTLTVINNQPPVVEPPIVTPNPGTSGNSVTVTVSATDPNGLPLTFSFDWGDGTTGTSNTHVYANPGTYTVTVTVSNGSSSTTVTTSVVVALSMKATKLKGVTHFGKPGHDFAHLTTIIPDIKAGFSPAGKTMDIDFGGVKRSFTLDPHGKATTGDGTVRLQLKLKSGKAVGGATRLWVNLSKGDFAAAWKDEGLDPAKPLRKASVPFILTITLDGTTYLGTLTTTANANATLAEFHSVGFK